MKTYQIIHLLQLADLWKYCMVLFKRAETLDLYYRIYKIVQVEKKKGVYGIYLGHYRTKTCRLYYRVPAAIMRVGMFILSSG